MNKLPLVLAQGLLIKLIRRLKAVASEEQIEVNRIFRVRTIVDTIKDATRRSLVMQHSKFGRIKETPRTLKIKGNKVSGLRISVSQRSVRTYCAECSVGRVEVAGGLLLIQA